MGRYASETKVSVDRSKLEIERILRRYGADQFMYGWDQEDGIVGFKVGNRLIRMKVPLPDISDFYRTRARQRRTQAQAETARDQAVRQRWRALALVIKAKLEAVESGIATIEDEFLAYTMLPGGQTMGEWAKGQLDESYERGQMPALLPGGVGVDDG